MTDLPLNTQIKDAVETSTTWAMGFGDMGEGTTDASKRISAGVAIAYDKAAQAAALAVQDAADYQRNMLTISTTVQGKAMAMMLASGGMNEAALVSYAMALASSVAAPLVAGLAAERIAGVLQTFPRS